MTLEETGSREMTNSELQRALKQFSDASAKLQDKYAVLLKESEGLRKILEEKDLEVKRSERLAVLGEMASAIAHEVRNPLGALKLFLSILREDLTGRPESLKIVDQMNKSIGSIDQVVSNILGFSKGDALRKGPVNINAIIHSQLELSQKSADENVTFKLQLNGNPYIIGNEEGLRQIFSNLIVNSQQALRCGGTVEIESKDHQDMIWICIRDDGSGIAETLMENLFTPFVTTKQNGIGLGLAIVKRIVEAHAGVIEAHNRTTGGAEFTIKLPRGHLGPSNGELA